MKENIKGLFFEFSDVKYDLPMSNVTYFKIGGLADVFICPKNISEIIKCLNICKQEDIPIFILGSGTNILVSDNGIRGVVIDMRKFNIMSVNKKEVIVGAGANMESVCEFALKNELAGLDFIYGMPGTVGGAVWMNARCFGREISDVLKKVDYIDKKTNLISSYYTDKKDFDYKISPFQNNDKVITEITFELENCDKEKIKTVMYKNKGERTKKGHYLYPSVGSIFKNNLSFKEPSGKIIESLSLCGYSIGDASISDIHGNIFFNKGNATAKEMLELIKYVQSKVKNKYGFSLVPEVIFVGD